MDVKESLDIPKELRGLSLETIEKWAIEKHKLNCLKCRSVDLTLTFAGGDSLKPESILSATCNDCGHLMFASNGLNPQNRPC